MRIILKNFSFIILFTILLTALFLRFYRIEENFIFTGEVGHNLLFIKNSYISRQIPLIGPPTSHSWLYFGPLFYWIYGPILILSNFNPLSHAYFGALVSLLIVTANYLVINKIFNRNIALFSSMLIAISPLFMQFSRGARFYAVIALLIYPFLYFVYEIAINKRNRYFELGLVLGSMFSFHFTPIMLIPFMVSAIIYSKTKVVINSIARLLVGFGITMLPFIVYDLSHSMAMTKNILLWIPYRILGFAGLYPKNNLTIDSLKSSFNSYNEFFINSFMIIKTPIFIYLFLFLMIFIIVIYSKNVLADSKLRNRYLFILLWFFWGIVAVLIHGSPPIHYFLPILPGPIILISIVLDKFAANNKNKVLVLILIVCIIFGNFRYYFSNQWFFIPDDKIVYYPYYVPYEMQAKAIDTIMKDAGSNKYKLKRVGSYDYFEESYSHNYQYLLWLAGNEPVNNAKLQYTLFEARNENISKYKYNKLFSIGDIVIIRN